MKKFLKITCAFTLMLCILVSSLVFANASDSTATIVYEPKFLNEAGDGEYVINADASGIPYWIQKGVAALTPTDDPSDFNLSAGLKYTNPNSDKTTEFHMQGMSYADAAGYLVKIENNEFFDFKLPLYILYNRNGTVYSRYQWGYVDWYLLEEGDTAWKTTRLENYGPTIKAGFKGYLYIPFNTLKNSGSETMLDTDMICGINFRPTISCKELTLSLPMFVDRATLSSDGLPSYDKVSYNGNEVKLFGKKDNYTTVYEPEFLDASGNKILLHTTDSSIPGSVQEGSVRCTLAGDISDFALSTGFKFTQDTSKAYATNIKVSPMSFADTAGFIIRLKTDYAEDFLFALQILFNGSNGKYEWGYADWYTLTEEDTEWKAARIENYGPTLPAKFDGYLYVPFDVFKNAGVNAPFVDTDMISGIQLQKSISCDEIILSAPIFVDRASLKDGLPTADKLVMNGKMVDLFSKYEGSTIVYESKFYDQAGTGEYTVNPTDADFPTWVEKKGTSFVPCEDPSNFGLNTGMRYVSNGTETQMFMTEMTYADAAGYIIKFKSNTDTAFKLPVYVLYHDGAGYKQGYQHSGVNWYLLDKDDTSWRAATVNDYAVEMEAGFDGYLYIPFNTLKSGGSLNWQNDYKIAGIFCWNRATYNIDVDMSVPMFVKRNTLDSNGLPTANKISLNGKKEIVYYSDFGDVDDNGAIDAADLTVYRQIILNTSDVKIKNHFDVTGDSAITLRDLVRVKRYLAGHMVTLG